MKHFSLKGVFILVFTIWTMLCNMPIEATEIQIEQRGNLFYILDNSDINNPKAHVYGAVAGISGSLVIPDYINVNQRTIPVTAIAYDAFKDCAKLTSVKLPSTVERIFSGAFKGCIGLSSFDIPKNVVALYENVFAGCSNMKCIILEDGEKELWISLGAFGECPVESITCGRNFQVDNYYKISPFASATSLQSIEILDNINCLPEYSFRGCSSVKNIVMPESIERIGMYSFADCANLQEIKIPDKVSRIEKYVFSGCTALTKVDLNDSISIIEDNAFEDCSSLTNIMLPQSLTTIKDCAFEGCSLLTDITFPQSLTTINDYAFKDCSSIKSNPFQKGLVYIGRYAFENCTSLLDVKFPNTLTTLGEGAFAGCTSLQDINFGYKLEGIGAHAFKNCTGLKKLTLATQISSIKCGAFSDCENLEEITFKDGRFDLVEIGDYAFYNCRSLKSFNLYGIIDYGSSKVELGKSAFYGCKNLETISFNSYVQIQKEAFSNCSNLKSIKFQKGAGFESSDIFDGCPIESIETKEDFYGKDYSGRAVLPFENISTIKKIKFGCGTIRKNEFDKSKNTLSSLCLGDGHQYDGVNISDSFIADTLYITGGGSSKIIKITYLDEDGYPSDDNAFGIGKFKHIIVDDNTGVIIPENAFIQSPVERFVLKSRYYEIGKNAFKNCPNLKYLEFNKSQRSVANFGTSCFEGCPIEVVTIEGEDTPYVRLPVIELNTFDDDCYSNTVLYISGGYNEDSIEKSNWEKFRQMYLIPDTWNKKFSIDMIVGESINLKEYLIRKDYELSIPGLRFEYESKNVTENVFSAGLGTYYVRVNIYLPFQEHACACRDIVIKVKEMSPLYITGYTDGTPGAAPFGYDDDYDRPRICDFVKPAVFNFVDGKYTFYGEHLESFVISTEKGNDWDNGALTCEYGCEPGLTIPLYKGRQIIFLPWSGDYTIEVSADFSSIILKTSTPPHGLDLFLQGDMNGWTTSTNWKFKDGGDGKYYYFICEGNQKIRMHDSFFIGRGGEARFSPINLPVRLDDFSIWSSVHKSNFTYFEEDWEGSCLIDLSSGTEEDVKVIFCSDRDGYIKYLPNSSAGNIDKISPEDVDTDTEEFYNLQGLRVANPTHGIFIRKFRGKVSKVIK